MGNREMRAFLNVAVAAALSLMLSARAEASVLGYADVVLDYFNSGAGPFPGPYGGTLASFPVPVSTSVAAGDDVPGLENFLSLPQGSYVTLGFVDETVIDGPGNDIFVTEIGASGERANVFISKDFINFVFLGVAIDSGSTAFDLFSISFSDPVVAIKIVGLDNFGGSPGFDVVNVRVLPGSVGQPVPEPASLLLVGLGMLSLLGSGLNRKKNVGRAAGM